MNVKCITPNLYVGPAPYDGADLEELKSLGITAILSLQDDEDIIEGALKRKRAEAAQANLTFRNVPVLDFDSSDLRDKLQRCVAELDRLLKASHTVYVHCTAGAVRSPTVVAAYLHSCLNWPLTKALSHVRKQRNCSPDAEVIRSALKG
jgi:protein-tyrosine phosphatase